VGLFDDDRQRFVSSAGSSFCWHRVLVLGSVASWVFVISQVRVLLLVHLEFGSCREWRSRAYIRNAKPPEFRSPGPLPCCQCTCSAGLFAPPPPLGRPALERLAQQAARGTLSSGRSAEPQRPRRPLLRVS
jgi:hypothetical protein